MRLAAGRENVGLGRTVFLIGAGCSKSAGIPLVPDMAHDLVVKLAAALHGPGECAKRSGGRLSLAVARWKNF